MEFPFVLNFYIAMQNDSWDAKRMKCIKENAIIMI